MFALAVRIAIIFILARYAINLASSSLIGFKSVGSVVVGFTTGLLNILSSHGAALANGDG